MPNHVSNVMTFPGDVSKLEGTKVALPNIDILRAKMAVLVNEVYYQVYGLLNIPPYKPHDFLISSISDFKNPRKVKYAASAPTYSFPFDLYPASELEKNLRFVDRNGRLVNSDTLFEWSSK